MLDAIHDPCAPAAGNGVTSVGTMPTPEAVGTATATADAASPASKHEEEVALRLVLQVVVSGRLPSPSPKLLLPEGAPVRGRARRVSLIKTQLVPVLAGIDRTRFQSSATPHALHVPCTMSPRRVLLQRACS